MQALAGCDDAREILPDLMLCWLGWADQRLHHWWFWSASEGCGFALGNLHSQAMANHIRWISVAANNRHCKGRCVTTVDGGERRLAVVLMRNRLCPLKKKEIQFGVAIRDVGHSLSSAKTPPSDKADASPWFTFYLTQSKLWWNANKVCTSKQPHPLHQGSYATT